MHHRLSVIALATVHLYGIMAHVATTCMLQLKLFSYCSAHTLYTVDLSTAWLNGVCQELSV